MFKVLLFLIKSKRISCGHRYCLEQFWDIKETGQGLVVTQKKGKVSGDGILCNSLSKLAIQRETDTRGSLYCRIYVAQNFI